MFGRSSALCGGFSRIKESWHNLPSILEGNIEPIIEALRTKTRAERTDSEDE